MTQTTEDLIVELKAERCRCGQPKRARQTFCGGCYHRLPPPLRRRLYDLVGHGYERAYADAIDHLDREPKP